MPGLFRSFVFPQNAFQIDAIYLLGGFNTNNTTPFGRFPEMSRFLLVVYQTVRCLVFVA